MVGLRVGPRIFCHVTALDPAGQLSDGRGAARKILQRIENDVGRVS